MPLVPFDNLPDSSRTWVFPADRTLSVSQSSQLLGAVDQFLSDWKAHGDPLTVGRAWTHDRFLTVAVDQSTAGASGCSIDGLFRVLKSLERRVGATMTGSGQILYRDRSGAIQSVTRENFSKLSLAGGIDRTTLVFDPSVTTLGDWRSKFESDVAHSWHASLLKDGTAQPA